jgi:hypothetical protein
VPNKLEYDFVKQSIEKHEYVLLSNIYTDNLQNLEMICPNNHFIKMSWSSFNSGHRCRECYFDRRRIDPKIIKEYINSYNYKIITKYIRSSDPIKLQCPEGHIFKTRWYSFTGGHRCPICYFINKTVTIDEIKEFVSNFGYKCLSKTYAVNKQLKFICANGHYYKTSWYNFKVGNRCSECNRINRRKNSLIKVKRFAKSVGYICLSNSYVHATQKLKFKCPEGHIFYMGWDSFRRHRCPECWRISNIGEGNPVWRGGISFEPYCEIWADQDYKQSIKERDENKCLNPYCFKTSKTLVIHHIDYNKKNCHPSNLITVCDSCNGRANKDREWHEAWYKAIIHRRYKI